LLENATIFTKAGMINFGYHVLKENIIDFFVSDTGTGRLDNKDWGFSDAGCFVEQMGSRLKVDCKKGSIGAKSNFTVECSLKVV
jgi:hypothetical protein